MRLRLMHNPKAGSGSVPGSELLEAIRQAGHEPAYHSVKEDAAWETLDRDPAELVVVAGGDGTVARVAKRLAGRQVPIAILPAGTANNLATALAVATSFRTQIGQWNTCRRQRFDVGVARWSGREIRFVESVGGGLLANSMVTLGRKEDEGKLDFDSTDEEVTHAIAAIRAVLRRAEAREWRVQLDGHDHSGRYLLVEALNIPYVGPNLMLAPGADVADGLLDVLLLGEEHREKLDNHLRHIASGATAEPNPFVPRRAHEVTLTPPPAEAIHIDDEIWPCDQDREPGPLHLRLMRHALTFLAP